MVFITFFSPLVLLLLSVIWNDSLLSSLIFFYLMNYAVKKIQFILLFDSKITGSFCFCLVSDSVIFLTFWVISFISFSFVAHCVSYKQLFQFFNKKIQWFLFLCYRFLKICFNFFNLVIFPCFFMYLTIFLLVVMMIFAFKNNHFF